MGNHNFVAKKPVTRVRKPRVVSSQNKQNKTLREQYFFLWQKNHRQSSPCSLKHISSYNIPVIKLSKLTSKDANAGLQGIATYSNLLLLLCITAIAKAIKTAWNKSLIPPMNHKLSSEYHT